MPQTDKPQWMNDASLSAISTEKLEFLQEMFLVTKGKKGKELMATVMPLLSKAKAQNLTLSKDEISLISSSIQKYSTAEEQKQMESFLRSHKLA